jgi:hypothetical protein
LRPFFNPSNASGLLLSPTQAMSWLIAAGVVPPSA